LTRGAKTTTGTATFQECTGQAALNGDLTNTQTWAAVKAATPAVLGQIIKRSSGASYQICTTAGAMSASEPAFSDTVGVTTTDTTCVWTSLGPVGSYTGGMAPFARLAAAFGTSWYAAGNTVFVSSNHAESQAAAISIANAGVGSHAGPAKILCHNSAGSYPPTSSDLTTGATISTTTAGNLTITLTGTSYFYGLTFRTGVGSASSQFLFITPPLGAHMTFDNCSFQIATTSGSNYLQVGDVVANKSTIIWNNCTVKFAAVGQKVTPGDGNFIWQNTGQILASGSSVPTVLFMHGHASTATYSNTVFEALDLSQIVGSLFNTNTNNSQGSVIVRDCKLHASATVIASAGQPPGPDLFWQLVRTSA